MADGVIGSPRPAKVLPQKAEHPSMDAGPMAQEAEHGEKRELSPPRVVETKSEAGTDKRDNEKEGREVENAEKDDKPDKASKPFSIDLPPQADRSPVISPPKERSAGSRVRSLSQHLTPTKPARRSLASSRGSKNASLRTKASPVKTQISPPQPSVKGPDGLKRNFKNQLFAKVRMLIPASHGASDCRALASRRTVHQYPNTHSSSWSSAKSVLAYASMGVWTQHSAGTCKPTYLPAHFGFSSSTFGDFAPGQDWFTQTSQYDGLPSERGFIQCDSGCSAFTMVSIFRQWTGI